MFCFGSGDSVPSACSSNSMKTRFQNSRKRSHSQPGAHSARPQPTSSPQSKNISESGPHGPGPPTDQKLSTRGSRTIRSGGIPIFSQAATATWSSSSRSSGSPAKTVTQIRSRSSFIRSNMNSQASSIAPSLKYWPNEKLPSISKKVSVLLFRPTSSMSGVRKTFCTVVSSGAGGSSKPRKYGIRGCIPAEISSVERSSARGISECEGLNSWPLDSKNSRKPARSSAVVRMAAILRAVDFGTAARRQALGGLLGRDLLADLLQRAANQPRDVHLRDADLLGDLRLGQAFEEAQVQDLALPLVEDTETRCEDGAVLRDLVLVLLGP